MNVDIIRQVANAIKFDTITEVKGFNMNHWHSFDGNRCIGGYCVAMFDIEQDTIAVGKLFDIPNAWHLCYPPEEYDYEMITREHAHDVLMILADTGEVNWDRVLPDEVKRNI